MRELINTRAGGPLVLPGAPDALGARVIEALGFEAVYITGAGVTNARLGVPDLGLITLTELADTVEGVREAVALPIFVDADTGFGGPLNVRRTVRTLERRGANAIQLEDQTFPKRCGHFAGKEVIPAAEMVAKLHAALDARDRRRTAHHRPHRCPADARARGGARARRALPRGRRGCHLRRGPGVSRTSWPRSAGACDGPLLVNIVEGGATPQLPAQELGALGFSIVLYANAALRGAMRGMQVVLEHLQGDRLDARACSSRWSGGSSARSSSASRSSTSSASATRPRPTRRPRVSERFDLRLSGGQVLLPGAEDLTEADVLVRDGTIAGLCAPDAAADVAQDVSVARARRPAGDHRRPRPPGPGHHRAQDARRRAQGDGGGRGRRRLHADRLPDDGQPVRRGARRRGGGDGDPRSDRLRLSLLHRHARAARRPARLRRASSASRRSSSS